MKWHFGVREILAIALLLVGITSAWRLIESGTSANATQIAKLEPIVTANKEGMILVNERLGQMAKTVEKMEENQLYFGREQATLQSTSNKILEGIERLNAK